MASIDQPAPSVTAPNEGSHATIHVARVPQLLVEMLAEVLSEGGGQLTRAETPAQDHS